ncbi:UNVERIFIED_CONTAM: hypothetical protein Sradi_7118800 [Sesamum radiatum]|uniref:ELMO domain-containing protein n=1 Tax=Sesamum radiatum TaxID=300843 RepID=A0AAW2IZM6_SESRA
MSGLYAVLETGIHSSSEPPFGSLNESVGQDWLEEEDLGFPESFYLGDLLEDSALDLNWKGSSGSLGLDAL